MKYDNYSQKQRHLLNKIYPIGTEIKDYYKAMEN